MVTITVKIPSEIAAQIEAEARELHVTKSVLIRESLKNRYATAKGKEKKTTSPPSIFDRTRHLAGSVKKAPPDLSTNKKHMDGFGA